MSINEKSSWLFQWCDDWSEIRQEITLDDMETIISKIKNIQKKI